MSTAKVNDTRSGGDATGEAVHGLAQLGARFNRLHLALDKLNRISELSDLSGIHDTQADPRRGEIGLLCLQVGLLAIDLALIDLAREDADHGLLNDEPPA